MVFVFKKRLFVFFILLCSLLGLLLQQADPVAVMHEYLLFTLVGVVGAIFANATGAGGGVVFVPLFNQFAFDPMNIVATSFAIQCFGMTAGALSWRDQYLQSTHNVNSAAVWSALPRLLMLTTPFSILGIWFNQYSGAIDYVMDAEAQLHWIFGLFSIALAIALFITLPKLRQEERAFHITRFDAVALPMIALLGGFVTAWLSIGVGEMVAVYLIMRNASVTMSIACAVILTAFSVWSGIGYFISHNEVDMSAGIQGFSTIMYPVAIFAGLGAIIGGTLAKHIVLLFKTSHVKVFFGVWVLFMGLASLPIW